MDQQTARNLRDGLINPPEGEFSAQEQIALLAGMFLDDEGDYRCIRCGRFNECCECDGPLLQE